MEFAETPEDTALFLEVAKAVGIQATAYTDPEAAATYHAAYAEICNTRNGFLGAKPANPSDYAVSARKIVAAGETLVRFTNVGKEAMQPFYDELAKRRNAAQQTS